jgi:fatty acid desaturase
MIQPKISYVISEEALVRLNSINNYIALIDLFKRFMLNVFLCYFLFTATNYSYSLAIIIWYIYSIQFQFWGYAGLGHEALHGRVFSSRVANQILYAFCSALTWNNSAMFRSTHLFHHRKTFSPDDLEAKSEQRWGLWDVLSYIPESVTSPAVAAPSTEDDLAL